MANRRSSVTLYAAFTLHFQLADFPAPTHSLLMFAEFLLRTYEAPKSVLNALGSLKTFHLLHGLPTFGFQDFQLSLFRRALPLTVRHIPAQAPPLPLAVLEQLCMSASGLGTEGRAFAALLATTFFSMSRLSSLAPPRGGGVYDPTRYPVVGDLQWGPEGATLLLKWAKNRQAPSQALQAPFLPLGASPACPVRLLRELGQRHGQAGPNTPLFATGDGGGHSDSFFTAPVARGWLATLLAHLGHHRHAFTFHSIRRGASHLAFDSGARVADIQALGGWRSQAVFDYLPVGRGRDRAAAVLAAAARPSSST